MAQSTFDKLLEDVLEYPANMSLKLVLADYCEDKNMHRSWALMFRWLAKNYRHPRRKGTVGDVYEWAIQLPHHKQGMTNRLPPPLFIALFHLDRKHSSRIGQTYMPSQHTKGYAKAFDAFEGLAGAVATLQDILEV